MKEWIDDGIHDGNLRGLGRCGIGYALKNAYNLKTMRESRITSKNSTNSKVF